MQCWAELLSKEEGFPGLYRKNEQWDLDIVLEEEPCSLQWNVHSGALSQKALEWV